jgi:sialic acid synthase SpsE
LKFMADNAVIPLAVPDLRGNEAAYLARCVAENWVSSAGPEVRALETRMAQLCGVDHAVATVNGTTALHLALITAGVGPGDLVALGMDRIKIASGELTNVEALRTFAGFGLPVILSTGMTTLDEVGAALAVLAAAGGDDVTLLHCTSLHPAPPETLNLRAMVTMAERFARPVGYSDHSLDDYASIAAVALGARVIEKHFTLDRTLPGPDHQASLEPDALAAMITRLRQTVTALGDGEKRPAPGEIETAALVRRSWHAMRDLVAGAVVGGSDVVLKRPADGLDPASSPVGRTLVNPVDAGAPVRAGDLS